MALAGASRLSLAGLSKPLIFGAIDGMTCSIGVILSLHHQAALVFLAALGVGVAELVGMAAGEWLSDDNPNGLGASIAIGAASGLGAVIPATPYLVVSGAAAIAGSVLVLVVIAAVIAAARSRQRGVRRALVETYGVLAAVFAAVLACGLLTPGA